MNILTGKNFAAALIAGLLVLASVENRADDLDSYLDGALRMQVFEELKENMQRQYEDKASIPAKSDEDETLRARRFGFPGCQPGNRGPGPAPVWRIELKQVYPPLSPGSVHTPILDRHRFSPSGGGIFF